MLLADARGSLQEMHENAGHNQIQMKIEGLTCVLFVGCLWEQESLAGTASSCTPHSGSGQLQVLTYKHSRGLGPVKILLSGL